MTTTIYPFLIFFHIQKMCKSCDMYIHTGFDKLNLYTYKYIYVCVCVCVCVCREREKAMAPPSSTLAWKILWTEEPGRLQSLGSLRVGQD